MNLKQVLENAAARFAAKDAIIMGDRRVSFRQLDEDANRVARALMAMGVKKGDRVAMLQASNPEFVTVFFGIIKAGAIACPLDSRYIADELERIFADCQPRVLVAEDPPLAAIEPTLARFKSIKHIITFDKEHAGKYVDYNEIIASNSASPVDVPIDSEAIAIISYTGGPTQQPHGVELSHRAVITEAVDSARVFAQTADDVMIQFALPMYHQFGLTAVLLASIHTGNTVVVVPGTGRSIASFMETVELKRGTIYMGVPYIYSLMINVARREGIQHDISSLRLCVSGGAPLEPVVVRLFKEYYGLNIIDVYGQTETVCHVTCAPIDGSGPPGSSGRPLPCWEIKIFDADDNELPPGEEGEIVTRGPVMSGFHNQPEATARIIRNGWLHTGDIGWRDEDGFLYITARRRRMLILKGQNIFPEDIEEVLLAHPQIADARVTGVIDIVRGETVRALVRLKPGETVTEAEIRHYCQERMADYKLPREVVFVEVMPEAVPLWRRPASLEAADISLEGGA
jgi:long-chain acyl-CoA synthetase